MVGRARLRGGSSEAGSPSGDPVAPRRRTVRWSHAPSFRRTQRLHGEFASILAPPTAVGRSYALGSLIAEKSFFFRAWEGLPTRRTKKKCCAFREKESSCNVRHPRKTISCCFSIKLPSTLARDFRQVFFEMKRFAQLFCRQNANFSHFDP